MDKILLIFTGGTICSFGDENNLNRDVDGKKAQGMLVQNFRDSDSPFASCDFEVKQVLNVLSEKMTIEKWNELLGFLQGEDFSQYQGIIMAHGTDTLDYMAALLSLLMCNVHKPLVLVSSHLPLTHEETNGNANFRAAVELICEGIEPGVYVTYRNLDGKMYIHMGAHLNQCTSYSQEFYSEDGIEKSLYDRGLRWKQSKEERQTFDLHSVAPLQNTVICIEPYVGLNYTFFDLDKGIQAVIHKTYHSETACVSCRDDQQESPKDSIMYMLSECEKRGIPLFVTPCQEGIYHYVSGARMIQGGAVPIYGMTIGMVYVKALVGLALGHRRDDLVHFINTNVCGEHLYGL